MIRLLAVTTFHQGLKLCGLEIFENHQNGLNFKVNSKYNKKRLKVVAMSHKKSLKIPKGVIRIRSWLKNRPRNGQKKRYKRTNNDLQNIHIKVKIE